MAGPEGAYRFWAMSAHQDIIDVKSWSPAPCEVHVAVLLKNGVLPGQEMLDLVESALSGRKVRPLTDLVTVEAPEPVSYNIAAQLYIYRSASMFTDTIVAQAESAAAAYADSLKKKLGADIVPEQIGGVLQKISGMYRVVMMEPLYIEIEANQVAQCGSITLTLAGVVDG